MTKIWFCVAIKIEFKSNIIRILICLQWIEKKNCLWMNCLVCFCVNTLIDEVFEAISIALFLNGNCYNRKRSHDSYLCLWIENSMHILDGSCNLSGQTQIWLLQQINFDETVINSPIAVCTHISDHHLPIDFVNYTRNSHTNQISWQ